MCQLDRVQYPRLQHAFKLYQGGMSDVDVARNTGIKRTTFIRYRKNTGSGETGNALSVRQC